MTSIEPAASFQWVLFLYQNLHRQYSKTKEKEEDLVLS